jgi:hypothetical protein
MMNRHPGGSGTQEARTGVEGRRTAATRVSVAADFPWLCPAVPLSLCPRDPLGGGVDDKGAVSVRCSL